MADLGRITIKGVTYDIYDIAMHQAIDNYVLKETGKGLSTNDFTNDYKNKLDDMTAVIQLKGVVSSTAELPVSPTNGDIYLVGTASPYTEKIWVESKSAWEDLGNVDNVDLSNYVTKAMHKEVTDWVDGIKVEANTDGTNTYTLIIPSAPTWS